MDIYITSSSIEDFSEEVVNKILRVLDVLKECNKTIIVFKEDSRLVNLMASKNYSNVQVISLSPTFQDWVVYYNVNGIIPSTAYKDSLPTKHIRELHEKAQTRFKVKNRELGQSDEDYTLERYGTSVNRLRFVFTNLISSDDEMAIIQFYSSSTIEIFRSCKTSRGDGKFVLQYNISNNKSSSFVGGIPMPEEQFIKALEVI